MKNKLITRYVFLALSAALMIYIFVMSAQSANVSTQSSGRVIRTIAKIVVDGFENKPIEYQMNFISSLQFLVRKAAHFIVYFSLGFSVCGCALTFDSKTKLHNSLVAFGISALYSASDEIHQLFVPGRSGQISDVLLDCIGIICGILFTNLVFFIIKKIYCRFSVRGKRREFKAFNKAE